LPENHLAYFVLDLVRELDLGAIEAAIQKKDPRGERPYAPRMMTALLLYAYCVGLFSSRKIERATYEDVAVRVLVGESHPHFTTVNSFRLDHREALAALFVQVLKLCRRAGLVKMGHMSLEWLEGAGEREQAQGDDVRTHEGGGAATRGRDRSPATPC
jgi:transposase